MKNQKIANNIAKDTESEINYFSLKLISNYRNLNN